MKLIAPPYWHRLGHALHQSLIIHILRLAFVPNLFLEDLSVGQTASRQFSVTESVIMAFAEVSTDHNPIHVDEDYAAASPFKGRIAHGMLMGAFISATMANDLPGYGSIYVSQNLAFKRPVRLNDEVTITVTITEIDLKTAHVKLLTEVRVGKKLMADGVAEIICPRRPQD